MAILERPTVTPSSRLLFWLRASFVFDAVFAAMGGVMIVQNETLGYFVLVFTGVRAALGVVALLVASHMLADHNPADDRPSVLG